MSTPKTIVNDALNKDIQRRPESPPIRAGAARKVGEETHIEITPDRTRAADRSASAARHRATTRTSQPGWRGSASTRCR